MTSARDFIYRILDGLKTIGNRASSSFSHFFHFSEEVFHQIAVTLFSFSFSFFQFSIFSIKFSLSQFFHFPAIAIDLLSNSFLSLSLLFSAPNHLFQSRCQTHHTHFHFPKIWGFLLSPVPLNLIKKILGCIPSVILICSCSGCFEIYCLSRVGIGI